jgi:hypothetical protein
VAEDLPTLWGIPRDDADRDPLLERDTEVDERAIDDCRNRIPCEASTDQSCQVDGTRTAGHLPSRTVDEPNGDLGRLVSHDGNLQIDGHVVANDADGSAYRLIREGLSGVDGWSFCSLAAQSWNASAMERSASAYA